MTKPPDLETAILAAADQVCAGSVLIFGECVGLGDPTAWHRDERTGFVAPGGLAHRIDLHDPALRTCLRRLWELSRHAHFVTLAQAYWLTGRPAYAGELFAQWDSWLDANPPGCGIHWASALELSLRAIAWCESLALTAQAGALTEDRAARIAVALAAHGEAIAANLSLYSSANNHLIGEAAGLAVLGLLLPELPGAARWRRDGLRLLAREAERQIHPDGVTAEQAFQYQIFVLDLYLLVMALAQRVGVSLPPPTRDRLRQACRFLAALRGPDGTVPAIGDADEAVALPWHPERQPGHVDALLEVAAALLDDPDLHPGPSGSAHAFWLLDTGSRSRDAMGWGTHRRGAEGRRAESAEEDSPQAFLGVLSASSLRLCGESSSQYPSCHERGAGSGLFPHGGYASMRTGDGVCERHLLVDVGPLGCGRLAAHGHADALSVHLRLGGVPMLIDPGTYCYDEAPAWRRYFRGTAAHNTVTVDGRDQSEMRGPFLWGRRARVTLHRWESAASFDYLHASHDGYCRAGSPVTHHRRILFLKPDLWLILDTLLGAGHHQVEQWFHVPPGPVELMFEEGESARRGSAHVQRDGQSLWLHWLAPPEASLRVREGETAPIQGWHSPRFGSREPAPAVVCDYAGPLPATLVTLCAAGPEPPTLDAAELPGDDIVALSLAARGETWHVALSLDGPRQLAMGDLRADALLAAAGSGSSGRPRLFGLDVARVSVGGVSRLSSISPVPLLDQGSARPD